MLVMLLAALRSLLRKSVPEVLSTARVRYLGIYFVHKEKKSSVKEY